MRYEEVPLCRSGRIVERRAWSVKGKSWVLPFHIRSDHIAPVKLPVTDPDRVSVLDAFRFKRPYHAQAFELSEKLADDTLIVRVNQDNKTLGL